MTDYYPQLEADALLFLLNAVQRRGTIGQVVFTTAAGVQSQLSLSGAARPEVENRRIRYSLHLRDPDNYPDPYANRVRRTRARYTFC